LMRNWESSFAPSSPIFLPMRSNSDDVLGSKLLGMKDGVCPYFTSSIDSSFMGRV